FLAETRFDEFDERRQRFILVDSVGLDEQRAALSGGQHHDTHDALGIDAPALASHPHFGGKTGRYLGDAGRWPGVYTQIVDDDHLRATHPAARLRHAAARPGAGAASCRDTRARDRGRPPCRWAPA